MVNAAGVKPINPHGWRGFTAKRATWGTQGPHEELNRLLKKARTSDDNLCFRMVNVAGHRWPFFKIKMADVIRYEWLFGCFITLHES
jgi:hypothetical protein